MANISIHALLAESDRFSGALRATEHKFLSTLSLRRATRSPCGERPNNQISIHALLAESDGKLNKLAGLELVFLSTLSLRRATRPGLFFQYLSQNFYPRSPCGERRHPNMSDHPHNIFLSTLSLRRATPFRWRLSLALVISIHALLAESDAGLFSFSAWCIIISIHALLAESDPHCPERQ